MNSYSTPALTDAKTNNIDNWYRQNKNKQFGQTSGTRSSAVTGLPRRSMATTMLASRLFISARSRASASTAMISLATVMLKLVSLLMFFSVSDTPMIILRRNLSFKSTTVIKKLPCSASWQYSSITRLSIIVLFITYLLQQSVLILIWHLHFFIQNKCSLYWFKYLLLTLWLTHSRHDFPNQKWWIIDPRAQLW